MRPTPAIKKISLMTLYLGFLNSSGMISLAAIYKKVPMNNEYELPEEIEMKTPLSYLFLKLSSINPMTPPIGVTNEKNRIESISFLFVTPF